MRPHVPFVRNPEGENGNCNYLSCAVRDCMSCPKLPGLSVEELQSVTGGTLHIEGDVKDLKAPEV